MANGSFLFGSPTRYETRPTYRQPQEAAMQSLLQFGLQNLQQPTQGFEPIAQEARRGFQQQTVPGLLERFTASGDNALSSPSLHAQLSGAGADLESRLAALRSQYGLQQQRLGLKQLQQGLMPMDETIMLSGDQGFLGSLAPDIGKAFGQAVPGLASSGYSKLGELLAFLGPILGGLFGGPVGGAVGGAAGSGLNSLIQRADMAKARQSGMGGM